MLSKFRVKRYKSLYDTEVSLEPLTVFIGPNGSGKSNICEALAVWSNFLENILQNNRLDLFIHICLIKAIQSVNKNSQDLESKFWQGDLKDLSCEFEIDLSFISSIHLIFEYPTKELTLQLDKKGENIQKFMTKSMSTINIKNDLLECKFLESPLYLSFNKVKIYDFSPLNLSVNDQKSNQQMDRTGKEISASLAKILLGDRNLFNELEDRLTRLVPNIARIHLEYDANKNFKLELIDKYSEHHISASDISDGTLRIIAFLAALYQEETPSIICFEEIENGVHPWLLHKMMELLKIVSTEGINGKPVQILLTTHSPLILNYVEPHQVRAVELDNEGKTQVHALPTDSVRFQKSLEAYDGELGELWFTNVFGGNPV